MLNLNDIIAKFERTPEQLAAIEAEEAKMKAFKNEMDAWEDKCYNEGIDAVIFNRGRDEICKKYGQRPTSEYLAEAQQWQA